MKDIQICTICVWLFLLRSVREALPDDRLIGQMWAAICGSLVAWTEVEA